MVQLMVTYHVGFPVRVSLTSLRDFCLEGWLYVGEKETVLWILREKKKKTSDENCPLDSKKKLN